MLSFFFKNGPLSKFLNDQKTQSHILRKRTSVASLSTNAPQPNVKPTHYSLDGGKIFVHQKEQTMFTKAYAEQVCNGEAYLCEVLGTSERNLYRFFMEFDIPGTLQECIDNDKFIRAVSDIVAEVVCRLFDMPCIDFKGQKRRVDLYWLAPSTYPSHTGYHLHIPDCVVEHHMLDQMTKLCINTLEAKLPINQAVFLIDKTTCKTIDTKWSDLIDLSVCRPQCSIRMPFSYKADKCQCHEKPCMNCEMRYYICRKDKGYYKPDCHIVYNFDFKTKEESENLLIGKNMTTKCVMSLCDVSDRQRNNYSIEDMALFLDEVLVTHLPDTVRKSNLVYMDRVNIYFQQESEDQQVSSTSQVVPWPAKKQRQMQGENALRKTKVYSNDRVQAINTLLSQIMSCKDARSRRMPSDTLYIAKTASEIVAQDEAQKWQHCQITNLEMYVYDYFPVDLRSLWIYGDSFSSTAQSRNRQRNKRRTNYNGDRKDLVFDSKNIAKRGVLEIVFYCRSVSGSFVKPPEAYCPYRREATHADSDYHQTNHAIFRFCVPVNSLKSEDATDEDIFYDLGCFYESLKVYVNQQNQNQNENGHKGIQKLGFVLMHDYGHAKCKQVRRRDPEKSYIKTTLEESYHLAELTILPLLRSRCTFDPDLNCWEYGSPISQMTSTKPLDMLQPEKRKRVLDLFN